MITLTDLLTHTRRLLHDENARTYSDYELTRAADDAIDHLSRTLALTASDLTHRTVQLNPNDPLPDDLLTLITICDRENIPLTCQSANTPIRDHTYRIENNHLITTAPAILTYHATLTPISQENNLNLPTPLLPTLAQLTALTIQNADPATKNAAIATDRTLIARRHRTKRRVYMPWKV